MATMSSMVKPKTLLVGRSICIFTTIGIVGTIGRNVTGITLTGQPIGKQVFFHTSQNY
jgi:hypothetical protein